MRLSCPSCQTDYDVPDAALAGRTRTLRCANCGNQWQAGPHPIAPSSAPEPTPGELEYAKRPRPPIASQPIPIYASPTMDAAETLPAPPQTYPPEPPARAAAKPIDPAEARQIADRESFAALLEASRQSHAQNPDLEELQTRKLIDGPSPWLISALVLLLAAGLIYLERYHIMSAWPPSIRLFSALGLS